LLIDFSNSFSFTRASSSSVAITENASVKLKTFIVRPFIIKRMIAMGALNNGIQIGQLPSAQFGHPKHLYIAV
jgi:hypothetical protein